MQLAPLRARDEALRECALCEQPLAQAAQRGGRAAWHLFRGVRGRVRGRGRVRVRGRGRVRGRVRIGSG